MLRAGFNVGVNTDNRLMSDVMPSSELATLATVFDLTSGEIERLVTNGIMAGFAPLDVRRALVDKQVRPWFSSRTSV
jgi:adenosine deaminase